MLARGMSILHEARASQTAIAAMTTYTLESTRAICEAAEQLGQPVILQAGASSAAAVGLELLAASALSAAHRAGVLVGVHLDHSIELGEVERSIELGYTSVMIDGSHLPFEDNVALTRQVVERAHAADVWVEAELGALAGDEDVSTQATSGALTDPDQAAEFAARTGVDALAVAVGNVHGFTEQPVRLDLERLRQIAATTPVPLVLHGASGLPDADVRGAVSAGVVKVNINAELRRAYVLSLQSAVPGAGDNIRSLQEQAIRAMRELARDKITLLAGVPGEPAT
jgi:ketose-bisphosphate aldolase